MSKRVAPGKNIRKMIVVVSSSGEIIATAGVMTDQSDSGAEKNQLRTGLAALPGQSIHVIDMPDDFFRCKSAVEKHTWLSRHRVVAAPELRLMEKYRASDSASRSR